jgi:hypothetical protein
MREHTTLESTQVKTWAMAEVLTSWCSHRCAVDSPSMCRCRCSTAVNYVDARSRRRSIATKPPCRTPPPPPRSMRLRVFASDEEESRDMREPVADSPPPRHQPEPRHFLRRGGEWGNWTDPTCIQVSEAVCGGQHDESRPIANERRSSRAPPKTVRCPGKK